MFVINLFLIGVFGVFLYVILNLDCNDSSMFRDKTFISYIVLSLFSSYGFISTFVYYVLNFVGDFCSYD